MMMEKWITKYKETGRVGYVCHFKGVIGSDAALCGADLAGDSGIYEEDPKPVVYGKVNCPQCKDIVAAVRKIRGNEIEKD